MATSPWRNIGRYGTVGFELILSMVIGYWVGHWLDQKLFPGRSWLTVVFTLGGVYAGFRALYKAAKQMTADAEKLDAEEAAEQKRLLDEALVRHKLDEVDREIERDDAEKREVEALEKREVELEKDSGPRDG
jgi:hypothetical protein